jgi:regulatory protein
MNALAKLQRYCAYQDRCHSEVRTKLLDLGVRGEALEEIMADLISDDFLNEERFAKSYTRGKFRMKQWGKIKILQGLRERRISEYCIKEGLSEIADDDYLQTISDLLDKYERLHPQLSANELKTKAAAYVLSRGFESSLVWDSVNSRWK